MDHLTFAQLLGNYGEFVGALAVVVTIVYLAKQIRHSNELSRFGAARDLMAQLNELNRLVTTDETLRQLLMRPGELSTDENERIYNFAMMFCNVWIAIQVAYDSGQIDKDLYASGVKDVRVELERWPNFGPAVQQWLENYPQHVQHAIFDPIVQTTGT